MIGVWSTSTRAGFLRGDVAIKDGKAPVCEEEAQSTLELPIAAITPDRSYL